MEIKEIEAILEAILFVSGEPVSATRLASVMGIELAELHSIAKRLADYYSFNRRGIRLLRLENSYQLCSNPEYTEQIRLTLETRKPARLSQPALEVLTIIAYYQPATRAYVDQIRGVDSSYTVTLLQNKGLIEGCGRLAVPGRPMLYRTTDEFLRVFNLTSLEDLPEIPAFKQSGDQIGIYEVTEGVAGVQP